MFFVFFFLLFFFVVYVLVLVDWLPHVYCEGKKKREVKKKNENTTDEFAYIIAPFLSSPPVTLHRHTGSGEI